MSWLFKLSIILLIKNDGYAYILPVTELALGIYSKKGDMIEIIGQNTPIPFRESMSVSINQLSSFKFGESGIEITILQQGFMNAYRSINDHIFTILDQYILFKDEFTECSAYIKDISVEIIFEIDYNENDMDSLKIELIDIVNGGICLGSISIPHPEPTAEEQAEIDQFLNYPHDLNDKAHYKFDKEEHKRKVTAFHLQQALDEQLQILQRLAIH